MAVFTTIVALRRDFRGYDDPGLPTGIWWISAHQTGNGTGGERIIDTQMAAGGQARIPSELFSLETVAYHDSLNGGGNPEILASNFDVDPHTAVAPIKAMGLIGVSIAGAISRSQEVSHMHPRLFLGRGSTFGAAPVIRFLLANVNVAQVSIYMDGYVWGPRAILAPGGPRRPVDGLLG